MAKKKTHEEYVAELAIKNPDVEVVEEYNGAHNKIMHHCLTHDIYWSIKPHNVLHGRGCPQCGKDKFNLKRARSHDEYVEELSVKNPTVEVVDKYIDANTPITHHCLTHDTYWQTTPARALQGVGCNVCHNERVSLSKYKTHEQYVAEIVNVNPNIVVLETYIDARTPILHKCNLHNVEWYTAPDSVLHGHGCPECGKEITSDKLTKSHEQYVDDVADVNKDIVVIGIYNGANTPILHKCAIDGFEWLAMPSTILSGRGCPRCNETNGERLIRQYLESSNISYEFQKRFDDCVDVRPLPFDFYLPEYNACIEFDGGQHFAPVDWFGGEESFKRTVKHDNIKNKYCEDNNILLLRIPYYEDVNKQLNNFLFI